MMALLTNNTHRAIRRHYTECRQRTTRLPLVVLDRTLVSALLPSMPAKYNRLTLHKVVVWWADEGVVWRYGCGGVSDGSGMRMWWCQDEGVVWGCEDMGVVVWGCDLMVVVWGWGCGGVRMRVVEGWGCEDDGGDAWMRVMCGWVWSSRSNDFKFDTCYFLARHSILLG